MIVGLQFQESPVKDGVRGGGRVRGRGRSRGRAVIGRGRGRGRAQSLISNEDEKQFDVPNASQPIKMAQTGNFLSNSSFTFIFPVLHNSIPSNNEDHVAMSLAVISRHCSSAVNVTNPLLRFPSKDVVTFLLNVLQHFVKIRVNFV